MARFLHLLIIVGALLSGTQRAQAFSGGSGTENSPFLIATVQDFEEIESGTTAHFKLVADLNGVSCYDKVFKGHFDGNGHTITITYSGRYIKGAMSIGLFTSLENATISRLKLKGQIELSPDGKNNWLDSSRGFSDANDNDFYYCDDIDIGVLAGKASGSEIVECISECNLSVKGNVISQTGLYNLKYREIYGLFGSGIGGLIGRASACNISLSTIKGEIVFSADGIYYKNTNLDNNSVGNVCGVMTGSTVSDCLSYVRLECSALDTKTRMAVHGGICGEMESSKIDRCFAYGSFGAPWTGFIAGMGTGGTISDCVTLVEGSYYPSACGRILMDGSTKIYRCYSRPLDDGEGNVLITSTDSSSKHGADIADIVDLTSEDWWNNNTVGWDFSNVWWLSPGVLFPPLLKETPIIDFPANNFTYGDSFSVSSTNPYKSVRITASDRNSLKESDGKYTIAKAGTLEMTISQEAFDKYRSIEQVKTIDVAKAQLSMSLPDFKTTYGEEPQVPKVVYEGFLLGDDESLIGSEPTVKHSVTCQSAVGLYPVKIDGFETENYAAQGVTALCEVVPRELTVCPADANRKYGEANPEFTVNYSGWVNDDDELLIERTPSVVTVATAMSLPGDYALTAQGGSVYKNYKFRYEPGILHVGKASLKVYAGNYTRPEGMKNPPLRLSFDGFVNSDDQSVLDELPEAICYADENSAPGDYPIYLYGGSDRRYNYILNDGNLTVTKGSGIEGVGADDGLIRIYAMGEEIIIENGCGMEFEIYTMSGMIVKRGLTDSVRYCVRLERGMYVVKVGGEMVKISI